MHILRNAVALSAVLTALVSDAAIREIAMRAGEQWWGVCNDFGRDMPFTEKSDFKCDLRRDNYSHQSLSFLVSDKGLYVYDRSIEILQDSTFVIYGIYHIR